MTTTKRVTGLPSGGSTSRVVGYHFLLLEGDESGHLLLEGDMQSGSDDALQLEGDMATSLGGTATRRITEPVDPPVMA